MDGPARPAEGAVAPVGGVDVEGVLGVGLQTGKRLVVGRGGSGRAGRARRLPLLPVSLQKVGSTTTVKPASHKAPISQ